MKRFTIYKNIRKKAVIFGLPLALFALMMIVVIISLLVIIFSFSFGVILSAIVFNLALYTVLLQITKHPHFYRINKVFPDSISNKQNSGLYYEQD